MQHAFCIFLERVDLVVLDDGQTLFNGNYTSAFTNEKFNYADLINYPLLKPLSITLKGPLAVIDTKSIVFLRYAWV